MFEGRAHAFKKQILADIIDEAGKFEEDFHAAAV